MSQYCLSTYSFLKDDGQVKSFFLSHLSVFFLGALLVIAATFLYGYEPSSKPL